MKKLMRLMLFSGIWFFYFVCLHGYAEVITYTPSTQKPGAQFTIGDKQCVDFVKINRPDLAGIPYYYAKNMPGIANNAGFKVDNTPEVGAVIVLPNIIDPKTKEVTGHAGIVQEVTPEDGKFQLTVIDNNFDKSNTIGKAEYLYNPGNDSIEELNYKYSPQEYEGAKDLKTAGNEKYSDVKFIHENDKVINEFKSIVGREPNADELIKYSQELLKNPNINISNNISIELQNKKVEELKNSNIQEAKNSIENKQTEEIKNASTQGAFHFSETLTQGELAKMPHGRISSELAKKLASENPNFDSSQNSARTPQQKLTPVSVSFTQAFDGLFTQSADSLGSIGGNHSGTLTDGTRVGSGSRPGTFTSGSFSGRTIAETGYTPATQNNAAFSGTSVGTATARGFQEGTLNGSMTITVPAGTQTATLSGNITINTDGSLSMPSYNGPVTVNGTGQKVGTMSGSWSQGATH